MSVNKLLIYYWIINITFPSIPNKHYLSCHLWMCVLDMTFYLDKQWSPFFKKFIYLFIHERDRKRQRHRQRDKKAPWGGAQCGTRSQDPRIMPWVKGRCSTTEQPRGPNNVVFKVKFSPCYIFLIMSLETF